MPQKIVISLLFMLTTSLAMCQPEFSNWHFGNGNGFVFTPSGPQIAFSSITSIEGVAAVSDSVGNLLFYTNGVTIWDRTHTIMQNGDDLDGHPSASQGVAIVPVPGDVHRYYVFTANSWHIGNGLYYSIVNMNLNGGNGGVEPGAKNVFVTNNQTERVVVVPDNACGYWLITHENYTDRYEARHITAGGITGLEYSYLGPEATPQGIMRFSPDFKKAVFTASYFPAQGIPHITLLDFNRNTGKFSNAVALPNNGSYPYGTCFSPGGKKVYFAEGGGSFASFYQVDISSGDATAIAATRKLVGAAQVGTPGGWADMQLGPDGKVYFSRYGYCIGVIPEPDKAAPDCGFQPSIYCNPNLATGLPNSVVPRAGKLDIEIGPDTSLCPGGSLQLGVNSIYSAWWSTGSTADTITIMDTGIYWVTVNSSGCRGSDTIQIIAAGKQVQLRDTSICNGNEVVIDAGGFVDYEWNDHSTQQILQVKAAGTYWVKVTDACGIESSDTITVTAIQGQQVILPGDTAICNGQQVTISAGNGFIRYAWFNGSQASYIVVDTPGIAWVETTDAKGCISRDSITINQKNCGNSLWVPTAFTPNNDGTNDVFKPGYYGIVEEFYIGVYNRGGELVFSSTSPDIGWDGKQKGIPANTQSFVWLCRYKLKDGERQSEKGTVVLIR